MGNQICFVAIGLLWSVQRVLAENCLKKDFSKLCAEEDHYCGDWDTDKKIWKPLGCEYRDVTTEQAIQCMGNHTLGFLGDSQTRDLCMGIVYFLFGTTVEESPDGKYDPTEMKYYGEEMIEFESWSNFRFLEKVHRNSFIFPSEQMREFNEIHWQIQYWEMFTFEALEKAGEKIITNQMVNAVAKSDSVLVTQNHLRPMELLFWNYGIHNLSMFNSTPYGEHYYKAFVDPWLKLRSEPSAVPSVWLSMNNECYEKVNFFKAPPSQFDQIKDANHFVHHRLHHEKIPYYDAASVLRTPDLCEVSADGVHVKRWTDLTRAKIFFNHVCDENWNWRGGVEVFI